MKTTPGLIAILLMSALFLCVSIYGWREEWFRRQLKMYGENTQAIVTDSSLSRAGAAPSPARLAYTFSYSNQPYTGRCFISDSSQRELKPGDSVGVRFLKNRPDVNWPLEVANSGFYKTVRVGLIVVTCAGVFSSFLFIAILLELHRLKKAARSRASIQHA